MGTRTWLRRLKRLEAKRQGDEPRRPRTDAEWADAWDCYRRQLVPRDAAFAAACAAYREALAQAEAACPAADPRRAELWQHFPALAQAWDRCAEFAEPLLRAACGEAQP